MIYNNLIINKLILIKEKMKKNNIIKTHYLSISYNTLINNRIVHYFLFLLEIYLIMMQIIEIYYNNFKFDDINNITSLTKFTLAIKHINKLPISIQLSIIIIIIIFLVINFFILNTFRLKKNIWISILINIAELLFYRLFSLFFFIYLFSFKGIYLYINIIFTIPYIVILILNFHKNHLFIFFLNLIEYPYDSFSMLIDLHFLIIKLFLSICVMNTNENISKFFFGLSIITLLVLLFYLTYILFNKSYYLMNNCNLNKVRYSCILTICLIILFVIIIGKNNIFNYYTFVCYINILLLNSLFICYFYDPYLFLKLGNDDAIENVLYYFFILDRDKNKYLLLEEKIEEHLLKCNRCNLCKKYNQAKLNKKEDEEIDLYYIIFNHKNFTLNLMNNILRGIRKNGKNSFINNSYYLINTTYIYCMNIFHKDYNGMVNTELMYEIINSENSQFLEEYNICLNRIKYTNNFLIKAKQIIDFLYDILNETKIDKIIQKLFKFGELLEELKYKEIKTNINNNGNYNGSNIEGLPNCSNLITICSLFYEELYNESVSNSGIYIRESPNLLEDLINNNLKNSKQITLEINIQYFEVKIIRAGGEMNKYENNNFFDFFPSIFKNRQIKEMKNILLHSNNNLITKYKKEKNKNSKAKKRKENKKQYIKFNFIIEEKEENDLFYRSLKLKLSLIFLPCINTTIYLNGIYTLDKDIIITEQKNDEEIILHYGNKEQMNLTKKDKNNKIIKKYNKEKYLGNKKLIKDCNHFNGCKKYNVYHFFSTQKRVLYPKETDKNVIKMQINEEQDDKSNELENSNKILIYNDLASQASSTTSSISNNNLISYNRGNKQVQNGENITKEFKIIKYVLLISIFFLFFSLTIEYINLSKTHKKLSTINNFYLSLKDYSITFNIIFFSILSLTCVGKSSNSPYCNLYMDLITKVQIENYAKNTSNIDNEEIYDTSNFYEFDLSFYYIDFTELIFVQNQLLFQYLEDYLEILLGYLSNFSEEKFTQNFKDNISHYKISQNIRSDSVILLLKIENITFTDFLLLMTSRCGIITKDINNLKSPIYILNKTGVEVFNNVYAKERLNSYQENIYLLILDNKNFVFHLNLIINEIGIYTYNLKALFKNSIYFTLCLNLILIIIIIMVIFGYIITYYIIIFKILQSINSYLKEKIGDKSIKDILRKKIDNLKLLLSFYENDINNIIYDINNIYTDYHDSYNLKIREESRLIKKDGKNENDDKNKNNKLNYIKLFKMQKKYNLFKYSGRKKIYLYNILLILTISVSLYIIISVIWILFFKKDYNVFNWVLLCDQVSSATNDLMATFLIMVFNNQTLQNIAEEINTDDFIVYIYEKLTNLYKVGKYFNGMSDILITTEKTMNYDCLEFYENLNNGFFKDLRNKFNDEIVKFYFTIYSLCEASNVMIFNNYKSIYLQIFNRVKIVMENFNNTSYNNIIEFIKEYEIVEIEIVFLITYVYLLGLMNDNIRNSIVTMMNKMGNNINRFGLIFLFMLLLLVFIIFFVYLRNINNDCKKFIQLRKVFKICNNNE